MTLIHGNCLEVLPTLEADSFDACVTDAPYHLQSISKRFANSPRSEKTERYAVGAYGRHAKGFMGKTWDGGDVAMNPKTWAAVLRVLKPGAHLLAFGGTRTHHRIWTAIEDAGFEIRDSVFWTYGSGFPKSHNQKGEWEGWGTALKPAVEPICLARKPLIGTVAENLARHGTGALNIDACRVETTEKITNHSRSAESAKSKGIYGDSSRQETHQTFGQKLGRWPANLIHDGSEDVLAVFPKTPPSKMGKPRQGKKGAGWGMTATGAEYTDAGSAARFFYCVKATKKERNAGCEDLPLRVGSGPAPVNNNHPTVKPLALMRYLCRLITPPGGTIVDPFTGSGSTGAAAVQEGFRFVGIEQEAEYVAIAESRIGHWTEKFLLS